MSDGNIFGLDIIREMEGKVRIIRDCLKVASDHQKSYTDLKRKDIEFQVGKKAFLKVLPWKKVLRFEGKENLGRGSSALMKSLGG